MELNFTKMQGLGNDFVVLNFTKEPVALSAEQAARIADRRFGVGCDQILIVETSQRNGVDFKYRILNADGSEVSQCGNGARCFLKYVHDKGLTQKTSVVVETNNGDMTLSFDDTGDSVSVDMGKPRFEPKEIPLAAEQRRNTYRIDHANQEIEFSSLSMGNPHAVLIVDNVCTAPVAELGPELETHSVFPERANIGFMQINNRNDVALRVYERGVGETLACGSGACAAVVAGIQLGLLDNQVTAHLSGGDLNIQWSGEGSSVMMTGPANTSFEGTLTIS